MKKYIKRFTRAEQGQSIVEFAIIISVLILLLLAPVDFYRYINTKMILCSAATESIGQITYKSVQENNVSSIVMKTINDTYSDKLSDTTSIAYLNTNSPLKDEKYKYYVYNSDLANKNPTNYHKQFENRESNFKSKKVELQLSCELEPITFWGEFYFGTSTEVKTPIYVTTVYAGGYTY